MKKRLSKLSDIELAQVINEDLEVFATRWKEEIPVHSHEAIDAFCEILLRGGKRFRGILAIRSYFHHGGDNDDVAVAAARIFEILQASLLIVDDIADRSVLRRGGPSAHMLLKASAEAKKLKTDSLRYGEVQAMNIAYAGPPRALNELFSLPISDEVKCRTAYHFNNNVITTISGQIDDVYNEVASEYVSESDIESVLRRKTALYTFLSPIELGAQLAGRLGITDCLREYSLAAGCTFQIADDIISTFGSQHATGKGNDDDIREGKITLLARHALDTSSDEEREVLQHTLGNVNATHKECDTIRRIFETTDAVMYAKERFTFYSKTARLELAKEEAGEFAVYLSGLIDHLERSIA